MSAAQEVRRLCRLSSTLWIDGDGLSARKALRAAQHLTLTAAEQPSGKLEREEWDQLRIEVFAAASRLFLRAEEPAKGLSVVRGESGFRVVEAEGLVALLGWMFFTHSSLTGTTSFDRAYCGVL